jgi:hypothetical protein
VIVPHTGQGSVGDARVGGTRWAGPGPGFLTPPKSGRWRTRPNAGARSEVSRSRPRRTDATCQRRRKSWEPSLMPRCSPAAKTTPIDGGSGHAAASIRALCSPEATRELDARSSARSARAPGALRPRSAAGAARYREPRCRYAPEVAPAASGRRGPRPWSTPRSPPSAGALRRPGHPAPRGGQARRAPPGRGMEASRRSFAPSSLRQDAAPAPVESMARRYGTGGAPRAINRPGGFRSGSRTVPGGPSPASRPG